MAKKESIGEQLTKSRLKELERAVLSGLRPVELQVEDYFKNLIDIEFQSREAGEALIDIGERIVRHVQTAEELGTNLKMGELVFPGTLSNIALMQGIASRHALFISGKATQDISKTEMLVMSQIRLADAMSRLGTFWMGKFGMGILSCTPVAITYQFNPGFDRMERTITTLADKNKFAQTMEVWTKEVEPALGSYMADIVRSLLKTYPIPAIGGSYSAPLTATGRLASTIQHLKGVEIKRFARGKGAGIITHAVTIGVPPNAGGRVPIYSGVLARSLPSTPPGKGSLVVGFSSAARERFRTWGTMRGKTNQEVNAIMIAVWRRGTYGRGWMASIARRVSYIPAPMFLVNHYADRLRRAMHGEY